MQLIDPKTPYTEAPLACCVGFFDGTHRGHQYLFSTLRAEAARRGLLPTVITFRQHPYTLIAPDQCPPMLQTLDERLAHIAQQGIARAVVLDFTPNLRKMDAHMFMQEILLKQFGAKLLVLGHDSQFGSNRHLQFADYSRYGHEMDMDVIRAERYTTQHYTINSSTIRQLISQGEMEVANGLLGYAYSLTGTVINGYKIGRTIGFPTANLRVAEEKQIPFGGVYVVRALVGSTYYNGMLNIGVRPTLSNDNQQSIEVHLFEFEQSIYNQEMVVEILHFLRHEQRMESLEMLTAQLFQDKVAALLWLKNHSDETAFYKKQ